MTRREDNSRSARLADVGAVVIGRNEGDRLKASLVSVKRLGLPLVYVDSGSLDGSLDVAEAVADCVLALNPHRPFTAARARNEGLKRLEMEWPHVRFVLFLDGDSQLDPSFPGAAIAKLLANPDHAIVTGKLRELEAGTSKYKRLLSLEWSSPAADVLSPSGLGGIMMARIEDILRIGGFNVNVIAGEDSELGVRLSLTGRVVSKIDVPMATHDAGNVNFLQWWRRSVRAGHAIGQRYALHGRSTARDCRREFLSTLFWGLGVPVAAAALAVPTRGFSLILYTGYGILLARMYRHFRKEGAPAADAFLAARYGVLAKFANVVGLLMFLSNSIRGKFYIIEYK